MSHPKYAKNQINQFLFFNYKAETLWRLTLINAIALQYIHIKMRKYTQFTLYARARHDNSVTGIIKRRSKLC